MHDSLQDTGLVCFAEVVADGSWHQGQLSNTNYRLHNYIPFITTAAAVELQICPSNSAMPMTFSE